MSIDLPILLEWITCLSIVVSALVMITRRNPLYAALWLINAFVFTGVLYVIHDSVFMGFLQVLTYAGAILVLVMFSIMLMDLRDDQGPPQRSLTINITGCVACLISAILLCRFFIEMPLDMPSLENESMWGGLQHLGNHLFTEGGLFPFEYITVLLLGTLVGCVQLAKRKEWL